MIMASTGWPCCVRFRAGQACGLQPPPSVTTYGPTALRLRWGRFYFGEFRLVLRESCGELAVGGT